MPKSPHSINPSPRSLKSNGGFIIIVALGILMVMIIVGISLQQTTMNTYNNIRMWDNYYEAQATGGSIVEYALWRLSKQDVGWNLDKVTCLYGELAGNEGGGIPTYVKSLIILDLLMLGKGRRI